MHRIDETRKNTGSSTLQQEASGLLHLDAESVRDLLPFPNARANKYSRGKLTVIGGSAQYPGAACLAAKAGEVMGAGYVEVHCAAEALAAIHSFAPSIVARNWSELEIGASSLASPKEGNPQACLLGSGFSGSEDIEQGLFFDAMAGLRVPVVVDGAAITYLASHEGIAAARCLIPPLIITPHGGEAARLARAAGIEAPFKDERQDNVLASYAMNLAIHYRATVALKGPVTYIADGRSVNDASHSDAKKTLSPTCATESLGCVCVMDRGTSALAKAGTGDVLAGMVASLLAQGLTALDACCLATYLHAESGRLAAQSLTDICVCAEDIVCFLPETIRALASVR